MVKIKIDPEFSKLIPNAGLDGELEREILDDGSVLNPLILWSHNNILLDGHRRHDILSRHPEIKSPKPVVLDLPDRQAAHDWIIRHQLSKRNVTEEQRRYLIGKLYYDTKKPVGNPNSDTVAELNTAAEIAKSTGLSERTIHRAGEFAEAIDSVPAQVKEAVLSGAVAGATKDLEALAELPKAKQQAAAKKITSGEVKNVKEVLPKPKPTGRGEAKQDVRRFTELEGLIGKAVRANTAIKDQFGGAQYHEAIRVHLNGILKTIKDWRKA